MAKCKLLNSLNSVNCDYSLSGVRAVYLANYYPPDYDTVGFEGHIGYYDRNKEVQEIILPRGEMFFEIIGTDDSASFSDALIEGGGGGKHRQHALNLTLNQYDTDLLQAGDALSLGRFIAIVQDSSDRWILLGRTNGLAAVAGGFDYNSGAAAGDEAGWKVALQGVSSEIAPLIDPRWIYGVFLGQLIDEAKPLIMP